ncbi:MAG TPA: M28 family peptidase [Thermoanaerobaculia bacterium]|nr:M28 family peptidase [Thermoanaerobaculia bacterium]
MTEPSIGWKQLVPPGRWARRPGAYPIAAYSEFMPPPRLGRRAYGGDCDPVLFAADDPWGWHVTEYEETFELRPGLAHLAAELLAALQRLGRREPGHGIGKVKLRDNPFWPEPLAGAGAPRHERYLALAALALARTQDDKGRVRWTLFGASEQGPARPFWRGFYSAPGKEVAAASALAFCRRLTDPAGGAAAAGHAENNAGAPPASADDAIRDLLALGFRILPGGIQDGMDGMDGSAGAAGETSPIAGTAGTAGIAGIGFWREDELPSWTAPLLWREGQPAAGVRFLLTFRPFAGLPEELRRAYLESRLHLLPFPGSLVFWGAQPYRALAGELPLALQVPLLHPLERSERLNRLRVPQSGWLHERHADHPEPATEHGPMRNTFRRTHRWQRLERHQDELAVQGFEDRMAHVLFSAAADDLGLYGKPMARNAQLWTQDYRLLLDGPHASRAALAAAAARLAAGGTFGYRFLYPAMRVADHEVYWHRPLAAFAPGPAGVSGGGGEAVMVPGAPLGYFTAYRTAHPDLAEPIELWPRLLDRPAHRAAIEELRRVEPQGAGEAQGGRDARAAKGAEISDYRRALNNARKLLDAWQLLGGAPLPESFARALVRLRKDATLAAWLERIEQTATASAAGGAPRLAGELRARIALPGPEAAAPGATAAAGDTGAVGAVGAMGAVEAVGAMGAMGAMGGAAGDQEPLTFGHTANRRFEAAYWRRIAFLAEGRFVNKDNADVVRDPVTLAQLGHRHRDLDALADYLLDYYRGLIAARGMGDLAAAGDLPFRWQTDFDFSWSGGWLGNQQGHLEERNVMFAIPGRDRGRAVIMADHYDTAYMEDRYGYQHGGHGPRLAAAGADDNHSATVALMLAAPIFLAMSRAGRLGCDVWLVHLTGEEFPSDCLGARHLTQGLVEGTLRLRTRPDAAARQEGEPAGEEGWIDLSDTRVQGVYVLDMVAHNNDREKDVFQICPGAGGESLWLALQAHLANRAWNRLGPRWNRRSRGGCKRGRRSPDGKTMPALALHPQLRGEVRPPIDPRSTLYNTDGQIFSDAGVPVVLFMEDYDINRHGYHDSHDTMENIALDYGAAVAAIAIETVARAATEPPPRSSDAGRPGSTG